MYLHAPTGETSGGMRSLFLGLLIVLAVAGCSRPQSVINSSVQVLETPVTATKLAAQYVANPSDADQTFRGKVATVSGRIVRLTNSPAGHGLVYLNTGTTADVICSFDDRQQKQFDTLKVGQTAVIKGRIDGITLGVIIVNDCSLAD